MRQLLFTLFLWAGTGAALASDPALETLERSGLLERFEQYATWEQTRSEQALILRCTDCEGAVDIFILVRDHRQSHAGRDLSKSYLKERKAHCQMLVRDRAGRCVGIQQHNARWLQGHRAQAVENGSYLSETVLFYGGHALTAVVREEGAFGYGDRMADVVTHALLRMTPAW